MFRSISRRECIIAIVLGIFLGLGLVNSSALWGLLFVLIFIVITLGILAATGAFRGLDPTMRRATTIFFLLKLSMAVVSLGFTKVVLAGAADAITYDGNGKATAYALSNHLPVVYRNIPGTGGVDWVVSHLYWLTTPNIWLGFTTFAWTSAIGTYVLFVGASRGWPNADRRRFGLALMFLPSLLYWTSPISKESIVIFGIGVFVLGIGFVFDGTRLLTGSLLALAGGSITYFIRPDVTLILTISTIVAFVVPWSRRVLNRPIPFKRILIILTLLIVLIPVIAANRQLLHIGRGQGFVQGALTQASNESTIGGNSAFTTATPTSVVDIPYAVISVLFRPFPWEVRTPLQVAASLEGIVLAIWSLRVLWRWRMKRLRPRFDGMMAMSVIFVLIFCIAFSSLGNFGLLVRERIQALPFLLIILNSFERVPTEDQTDQTQRSGLILEEPATQ
jgi:hypothetical protein